MCTIIQTSSWFTRSMVEFAVSIIETRWTLTIITMMISINVVACSTVLIRFKHVIWIARNITIKTSKYMLKHRNIVEQMKMLTVELKSQEKVVE